MVKQIDRVVSTLFKDGEPATDDVKFFRGTRADATAEEFARELSRADAQVRTGNARRSETLDSDLT